MGRHLDVVEIGVIGDLLEFQQSAHLRNVGRDDARRLLFNQLAKALVQVEVLAGADRRPRRVRDAALRFDIAGRHRVLEPDQVDRLERLRQLDGVVDPELPVRIHRHHDLGADGVPHRPCDAHHPRQLLRADHAVERLDPLAARMIVVGQVQRVGIGIVEIEFDRRESRRHHLPGAPRVVRPAHTNSPSWQSA